MQWHTRCLRCVRVIVSLCACVACVACPFHVRLLRPQRERYHSHGFPPSPARNYLEGSSVFAPPRSVLLGYFLFLSLSRLLTYLLRVLSLFIFRSSFAAFSLPLLQVGPPRRPAGVLITNRAIQHFATITGELLAVDIECRLEAPTRSSSTAGVILRPPPHIKVPTVPIIAPASMCGNGAPLPMYTPGPSCASDERLFHPPSETLSGGGTATTSDERSGGGGAQKKKKKNGSASSQSSATERRENEVGEAAAPGPLAPAAGAAEASDRSSR